MHHLIRTNLSLDDLVKKSLPGKKSITLIITLLKKKALKQNVLTEVNLRFATFHVRGMAPPLELCELILGLHILIGCSCLWFWD